MVQYIGTTGQAAHDLLVRLWDAVGGSVGLGTPRIVTADSVVVDIGSRVGLLVVDGVRVQRVLPLSGDEIEVTDFEAGRERGRRILHTADVIEESS